MDGPFGGKRSSVLLQVRETFYCHSALVLFNSLHYLLLTLFFWHYFPSSLFVTACCEELNFEIIKMKDEVDAVNSLLGY